HFHTDHPVFSCSKIEQKQLNTWVSFQSAEQPLLGQFSVSGNMDCVSSRLLEPQERLFCMVMAGGLGTLAHPPPSYQFAP
ncbi:hypothetical protein, partial [Pseudomonas sp. MF6776]|uniref:hypothetical protein n=1 Tax=Pseudomonas sp. MF6776 TaxID=2797534 RepID=UPI001F2AFAB8